MSKLEKSMQILNSIDLMSFRTPEGEFGFSPEQFFKDTNIDKTKSAIIQVAQNRNVEVNKNNPLNNIVSSLVNGVLEQSGNYNKDDLQQSNFDLLTEVADDIRENYVGLKNQKEVKGDFTRALQESRADRDNVARKFFG